jgi:hypothetical protein
MTSSTKPSRSNVIGHYHQLYSKFARFSYNCEFPSIIGTTAEWFSTRMCPASETCGMACREVQEQPEGIDVEVDGIFPGVGYTTGPSFGVISAELYKLLEPHMPKGLVTSDVYLGTGAKRRKLLQVAFQMPRARMAYKFRRKGSTFRQCPGCAEIVCNDWSRGEAFVVSDVKERTIIFWDSSMYIHSQLVDDLRLREFSDDIRFYKIPLLKEPEDGWILPNDPGWDGVLRSPEERAALREVADNHLPDIQSKAVQQPGASGPKRRSPKRKE